jgi:hydrogenase maturation protein HypF
VLAVGGELKAAFCLAAGADAFMSQHIGDMGSLETLAVFERTVDHLQSLFRIKPQSVACDMHPAYLSTRWAKEWARREGCERRLVQVQHHHAHIAAVMAEHGLDGATPVIGFSFDGAGYGPDGAIWGGEAMLADYRGYLRTAHLRYAPLPGGDAATRRPYRAALAHLWAANIAWNERLPSVAACSPTERGVLRRQCERGLNTVPTSSMGRLFDAVASLAGVRQTATYEGQPAMELEALADEEVDGDYRFALDRDGLWDPTPVLAAVVADVLAGVPAGAIAMRFHRGVAALIRSLAVEISQQSQSTVVALGGGVFQNVLLLRLALEQLEQTGLRVIFPQRVPANDGGLALGQAIIASALLAEK